MNEDRHLSGKCVIRSSTNGWMNESLTVEWVQYVVGRFSFAPRFLVRDTYKCHMTNVVKEALDRLASIQHWYLVGARNTSRLLTCHGTSHSRICVRYRIMTGWQKQSTKILSAWESLPNDVIKIILKPVLSHCL